jgi:hypothetical protein
MCGRQISQYHFEIEAQSSLVLSSSRCVTVRGSGMSGSGNIWGTLRAVQRWTVAPSRASLV